MALSPQSNQLQQTGATLLILTILARWEIPLPGHPTVPQRCQQQ